MLTDTLSAMSIAATPHAPTCPFDRVPLDRTSIKSDALDLASRKRTNPFPWRGQFSPELVELLLTAYAPRTGTVLDPFAGVGTTLWESARHGLNAVGTEINPAAITMAQSVRFLPVAASARRALLSAARKRLAGVVGHKNAGPLFNGHSDASPDGTPCPKRTLAGIIAATLDEFERTALANTLLRAMESERSDVASAVFAAFDSYAAAVLDLPHATTDVAVHHADARSVPVADGAIDLVLTSPPYINVFNYHQNGRAAMETLGWDLLRVARSEFGSNRKNRGNRFLTVIQYALDMTEWLTEMHRVLSASGRLIVIIGRESNVRSIAFKNGELVASLAESSGFTLTQRQERQFVTRFGEPIVEDILHFQPAPERPTNNAESARQIALSMLRRVSPEGLPPDVASDLCDAIRGARIVQPSPLLHPEGAPCLIR